MGRARGMDQEAESRYKPTRGFSEGLTQVDLCEGKQEIPSTIVV